MMGVGTGAECVLACHIPVLGEKSCDGWPKSRSFGKQRQCQGYLQVGRYSNREAQGSGVWSPGGACQDGMLYITKSRLLGTPSF